MQFRSAKHATDGGTSRRFLDRFHTPRTSSKRRRAPVLEMLEGRTLLSISASSPISSTTIGVLTFSDTASTATTSSLCTRVVTDLQPFMITELGPQLTTTRPPMV